MSHCTRKNKLPEGYDPFELKKHGCFVTEETEDHIFYLTTIWATREENGNLYISYDITDFSLTKEAGGESRWSLYVMFNETGPVKMKEQQESQSFWFIEDDKPVTGHAEIMYCPQEINPQESLIWQYYLQHKEEIPHSEHVVQ